MEQEKKIGASVGTIIVLLILCAGGLWVLSERFMSRPSISQTVPSDMNTYDALTSYGLSFSYPYSYVLYEDERGNGERGHFVITIEEDSEENRLVRAGDVPAREGPVAMTIDIIDNALEKATLSEWILSDARSNYKLAKSPPVERTLTPALVPALMYSWSGLYEADTVVASYGNYIYVFTTTYVHPDDDIRRVFVEDILGSLRFSRQKS